VEEGEGAIEEGEGGTEAAAAVEVINQVAEEVTRQVEVEVAVVVAARPVLQVLLDRQALPVKMGKTEKTEKKVTMDRLDLKVLPEKKDQKETMDHPDRKARQAKKVIRGKMDLPDQTERREKTAKTVHLENQGRWVQKEIPVFPVIKHLPRD
jgi:hypothetical protein